MKFTASSVRGRVGVWAAVRDVVVSGFRVRMLIKTQQGKPRGKPRYHPESPAFLS